MAIALVIGGSCSTADPGYKVRFGRVGIVWKGEQPYQTLIEETTVVRREISGWTALGFAIYPSSDAPYELCSVHYLPEAPVRVGRSMTRVKERVIRSDKETVRGPRVYSFGFDEGDPLGAYRIEVYADGQLVGSATITVVDPQVDD